MKGVSIECRCAQTDAALAITYTIHNGGGEELGVFNRIRGVRTDGGVDFERDRVYAELEGDVLRLSKMALPVPAGVHLYKYIPPNVSRLRARESLSETFVAPIPIQVQHPWKLMALGGHAVPREPRMAKHAELAIGVFSLEGITLVSEHPAFAEVLSAMPAGLAVERQGVLSASIRLSAPIRVLDYKPFPRDVSRHSR